MHKSVFGVVSSLGGRHWTQREADDELAREHMLQHGVSDLVGRLLAARGVRTDDAPDFLNPRLKSSFPDPSTFADMDDAAACVLSALTDGRTCSILADYDADGGCAAALLTRYMRHWGVEPGLYVPDRLAEGYGPNADAFASLKDAGCELVITVDCGGNAHEALHKAHEIGLDVVVLDHHLMHGDLPPARAIVNPNRPDCASGCGFLAGVGVVLILIVAVNRLARARGVGREPLPDPRQWLDICAMGTVCDVVPLVGLNRAIVTAGLPVLARRANPGVDALATCARITSPDSTADIAFGLGPRLNSGGRLGDQTIGARLLCTDDPGEAAALADRLEATNTARKEIESGITEQAISEANAILAGAPDTGILTVAGEGWHPGVVGIVASRLVDRFFRPAIVIGWADEFGPLARGSARSVPGVSIGDIVSAAADADLLVSGGGHAMAAGMSLTPQNIPALEAYMADATHVPDTAHAAARRLNIDALIAAGAATPALLDQIDTLGPFGSGAPEPIIAMRDVRPGGARRVGGDHVAFTANGTDGGSVRCIAFRQADTAIGQALFAESRVHLAGKLRRDAWRGANAVQVELVDAATA